ncbi:MAG: penicillin-binding protein activator LpoB [Candidatus Malihini olakiniferum]
MKNYLILMWGAMALTGCMTRSPEPQPPAQPRQPKVVTPLVQPVPTLPKIQILNWEDSVVSLIAQMLQSSDATPRSLLLVDSVKNNTNGSLPAVKAATAIYDALSNGKAFTLIPREQVAVAKQTLGLFADDSLGSRSKEIGLARYVSAQYVLYSDISGDVKTPQLDMQLMLVQTGEIVWSGNVPVH